MSKIKTKTDEYGTTHSFKDSDGDKFTVRANFGTGILSLLAGEDSVYFYATDAKTIIKLIKKAANL